MAQYEHLPIYREAYKFLIFCENAVRNFSRYNKYTHGTDLRNASREVVKLIVKANNSREKTEVLEDLRLAIEETRLLVRICKEVRAFNNFRSYETAVNHIVDISRQAEGWLKKSRQRENGQNRVLSCE